MLERVAVNLDRLTQHETHHLNPAEVQGVPCPREVLEQLVSAQPMVHPGAALTDHPAFDMTHVISGQ
jgi:hypothetical protein